MEIINPPEKWDKNVIHLIEDMMLDVSIPTLDILNTIVHNLTVKPENQILDDIFKLKWDRNYSYNSNNDLRTEFKDTWDDAIKTYKKCREEHGWK